MLVNTVGGGLGGGIEYNFEGQILIQIPPESRAPESFLYLCFKVVSQILELKE